MVGEIRDGISAGLALQAALTGHLVLTTLHASSTVDVRNRLINMGVSTYLLDSLKLFIISQKLVSKTEGVGRTLICELSNA
jgi:type II secretory ATPase GspE/PulE/Tfp pilus assembly ATPase PilB-like protein